MENEPSILVATQAEADARLVARVLADEFKQVHLCTNPQAAATDFDAHAPAVIVLSFDTVDAAQRYYASLYRSSRLAHAMPHRTIVLCARPDLQRVYDLCKYRQFDDYVLFWPATNDGPRLKMAIHHALRQLSKTSVDTVTLKQLAAPARRLAALEPGLAEVARRFAQEVDKTNTAALAAERIAGAEFRSRFGDLGEAVKSLCSAAQALASALGPQLQGVREMSAVARRVKPAVLIVDDDGFQRTLLRQLLAETSIELVCASSGAEALGALWTERPDLVLMDVDLPDLDGVEVTRRLKSVRAFADVPVIIVTGHSQRAVVMESLKAGAADFMVKPYARATLLEKLETFLPGSTK